MPTIYDIDYDKLVLGNLPPDKRFSKTTQFVRKLLYPLQYNRDIYLGQYADGSTATLWVNSTTYSKYDQVIYKSVVYESLIDSNLNINPTDQTAWRVIIPNFIGVNERINYNGIKLIFEYAINKYFGTTFRQPPNVSDIYITTYAKPFNVFVVGADESNSSVVYSAGSPNYVINDYDFAAYVNMEINIPSAVFNALDPSAANCDKIVRNFANNYLLAGIDYNIITY